MVRALDDVRRGKRIPITMGHAGDTDGDPAPMPLSLAVRRHPRTWDFRISI